MADRTVTKPWPCSECGRLTVGSVGPTGLVWLKVCQVCKDRADHQAEAVAVGLARQLEVAASSLIHSLLAQPKQESR